jgi:hypothetical protein
VSPLSRNPRVANRSSAAARGFIWTVEAALAELLFDGLYSLVLADPGGLPLRSFPLVKNRSGWLLNGRRYESEAEYLEALRKRDERRARWMAALERDGFLSGRQR